MEAKGNYQKAIGQFKRIIESGTSDRTLTARAYLQIGKCHERLGNREAMKSYEVILSRYPEQRETATEARVRLNELKRRMSAQQPYGLVMRRIEPSENFQLQSAPSPDGSRITTWRRTSDTSAVFGLYDLNTQEAHDLIHYSKTSIAWIVWAPDGRNIAFSRFIKPMNREVCIIDAATRQVQIIYSRRNELAEPCGWSSDGNNILMIIYDTTRTNRIGFFDLRNMTYRDISTQYKDTVHADTWLPRLSPDGKYYLTAVKRGKIIEIKIFSVDGSSSITLADSLSATMRESPVWTPDGKHIIMMNYRGETSDLSIVPFDSGRILGSPILLKSNLNARTNILGVSTTGKLFLGQSSRLTKVITFDVDTATLVRDSPPREIGQPQWFNAGQIYSPSGTSVIYSSRGQEIQTKHGNEVRRLYITPGRNTLNEEIDLQGYNPFLFLMSPDSQYLFFDGWTPQGKRGLFSLEFSTQTITNLIFDSLLHCIPRLRIAGWHKNMRKLFFECCYDTTKGVRRTALYGIDPVQKQLHEICQFNGRKSFLSPDGSEIVYVNNDARTVEVKSLINDSVRVISRHDSVKVTLDWPCWSRDGKWVSYVLIWNEVHSQIRTVSSLGGTSAKTFAHVKEYPTAFNPQWSPDGKKMIISAMTDFISEYWIVENFIPAVDK